MIVEGASTRDGILESGDSPTQKNPPNTDERLVPGQPNGANEIDVSERFHVLAGADLALSGSGGEALDPGQVAALARWMPPGLYSENGTSMAAGWFEELAVLFDIELGPRGTDDLLQSLAAADMTANARLYSLVALMRSRPAEFGEEAHGSPLAETANELITGLADEFSEGLAQGVDDTRLLLLNGPPDWEPGTDTSEYRALVELAFIAPAQSLRIPWCKDRWAVVERPRHCQGGSAGDGSEDPELIPIAVLESGCLVEAPFADVVAGFLDPQHWPSCAPGVWRGMDLRWSDGMVDVYEEKVTIDGNSIVTCLGFSFAGTPGYALAHFDIHPGQEHCAGDGKVCVDNGFIEVKDLGDGTSQVRSKKDLAFQPPLNGHQAVMIACALGWGTAGCDMATNCSIGGQ